ncbi:hypothetical protein GH714_022496 [Hevea brasiliensis]|uniref:Uncharacterized protein n=1 Tax=Hevea brasiliensis TaxID=3981 RepID=A0A6A6L2D0_HEVBR|nr:hypothetical protein GH714_022496 [Hevea brasiliensis]
MDSRNNIGDAFSVPQGREYEFTGSWVPATPEKHIATRYNSMPIEGLGNGNHQELARIPTVPIASPDRSPNRSMNSRGRLLIPTFHSQVSSLRESRSGELLFPSQTHCLSSSQSSSCNSLLQIPQRFQAADSINKTNMKCRTKSDIQMRQDSELLLGHQSGAKSNLTYASNQLLCNDTTVSNRTEAGAISISDKREAAVQPASTKEVQMDNFNVNARATDIRMQHLSAEGIGQIAFPAKIICKSRERSTQMMSHNTQSVAEISHHFIDGRGYKREFVHVEQTGNCTANPPDYHLYSCMSSALCSLTQKKRKIENGISTNTNGLLPSHAAVNHSTLKISSSNNVHSTAFTVQRNRGIQNSYLESYNFKRKENNRSTRFPADLYTHQVASEQDLSKQNIYLDPTHAWKGLKRPTDPLISRTLPP